MATFKLSKSFIEYSVVSQTSQAGDYVALNLRNREKPKRGWRSTSLDAQEIVLDLLSARANPEILVELTNLTEIEFVGSDDGETFNGWSGEFEIELDEKQGVYRLGATLSGFNHRYIKIVAPVQTPAYDASFYAIGTIAIMSATTALTHNPQAGTLAYRESSLDGFIVNEFDSGGHEVFNLTKVRPLNIELAFRQPIQGGSSPVIWEMFRNKSDIVYLNFGLGKSWQAYLVRRVSPLREVRATFSYLTFDMFEAAIVV